MSVNVSSKELLEALDIVSSIWGERIDKLLARADASTIAAWAAGFSSLTKDELLDAAIRITQDRRRLTKDDNPIGILSNYAFGQQATSNALPPAAQPYGIDERGRVGHIYPRDLEGFRIRAERDGLTYEQLGVLYDAARHWSESKTPCRRCRRDATKCPECRIDHPAINCTEEDRNIAIDHLREWLKEAWTTATEEHRSNAHKSRAAVSTWKGALKANGFTPGRPGPVAIGEVVAQVRTRKKIVVAAQAPPRKLRLKEREGIA